MRKSAGWLVRLVALIALFSAPAVAAHASWRWATTPAYESHSTETSGSVEGGGQVPEVISSQETLVEVNGPGIYALLLVPIILAALPLISRLVHIPAIGQVAAAGLFLAFVFLTGFSIGLPYLPAAALALLGAAASAAERDLVLEGLSAAGNQR